MANFVTREKAYDLKSKGFNEPCKAYYRRIIFTEEYIFFYAKEDRFINRDLNSGKHSFATAPTVEEAEAWEKANL